MSDTSSSQLQAPGADALVDDLIRQAASVAAPVYPTVTMVSTEAPFYPSMDRYLVEKLPPKTSSTGGLHLPGGYVRTFDIGRVIACGDGILSVMGSWERLPFEVGAVIAYVPAAGIDLDLDPQWPLAIVSAGGVLGRFDAKMVPRVVNLPQPAAEGAGVAGTAAAATAGVGATGPVEVDPTEGDAEDDGNGET